MPALYSVEQYSGRIPDEYNHPLPEDARWHGWAIKEHTLFGGSPVSNIIAYCQRHEDAVRIADALRSANASAAHSDLTIHVHLDGKEVAKATLPHMAETIRSTSSTRNF